MKEANVQPLRCFRWCLLAFLWALPCLLTAQNSRIGSDTLELGNTDTLRLTHPYLTPYSESLQDANGNSISTDAYSVNYLGGYLILKDATTIDGPISVSYRFFPRFLDETFALRTFTVRKDTATGKEEFVVEEYDFGDEQPFFIPSNVRRSGSISRGISVGNNQSLSVTSGLRLQLEGDLGEDLKLQAAITDENIPIQPDGTTQQIQDFDRVFIQLLRDDDRVILGDFEINHRGTQFANFYRNVQGIGVRINEGKVNLGVSGAVAKGKFNTNSFQGEEGKQGPYRLTGRNGEAFIIVLAGSEKVFLNGDLMVRGEANDYVMDYNSGELRFTSQRVINSAARIVVDFEYTDRYYNRSLFFIDGAAKAFKDKLSISASYGRDADNQNAPIDELTDEARDSLRLAGDNQQLAFISGVDSVGPATVATAIRYTRNDTTINNVTYERYLFSGDTSTAIYQIVFTSVGPGNGFYQKASSLVNGTIYEWTPPDLTGQPTGSFAPIRVLVPAKALQVVDVKAEYKLGKKVTVYTEGALSAEDKNRFSALDDEDNQDVANRSGIRFEKLKLGDSLELKVDLNHRYVGQNYINLDRVYKVEYGREWNFDDLGERLVENVSEATAELRYKDELRVTANTGVRTYGTRLFSLKQMYEVESSHKSMQGRYKFTTVSTEDKQENRFSRWNRHNGDIFKTLGNWKLGSEIWLEDRSNEQFGEEQSGAFRFNDLKPYLKYDFEDKLSLHLYYNYRKEYEFADSLYREKSEAHTEYMKVIWSPTDYLSFQNTSSLRNFKVLDNAFLQNGLNNSQNFITNLQASYFTKNRLIFSNLIYEATSEQLARQQVAYLEVNPGQGEYEWIDANEDGIQDLDEFQYSVNPTRQNFFVRVVVPTRELFPTTALNLSGNFKLDFKKAIARGGGFFKETLRNFLSITNFRVAQKKTAGTELANYLIDPGDIFADTSLLDAQYTFKQDVYFYRNNKVGDLKLSYLQNKSKQFLESGTETRDLENWGSTQRLNLDQSKSIENELAFGFKRSTAAAFSSRNYNIDFFEVRPRVNFQLSRKVRLSAGYEYKHKENKNDSLRVDATVNFHKLIFDGKINLKARNNIFAKVELVRIGQEGMANFSAEYELRESLEPGFNAIWQVFSTIYLSKSLELGITYDGRASQGNRTLHGGRVQLKAFF